MESLSPRRDVRVCFVGDSFVAGTGDTRVLGWTGRVCARAIAHGFAVTHYNLGVRRDTSADILARWRQECRRRLPASVDGRVVLSFGVNDTDLENGTRRVDAAASVANARRIWDGARAEFAVCTIGPPPVADAGHNERIAELSRALESAAAQTGTAFLPVFDALSSSEVWMTEVAENDASHPRAGGYDVLAALVERWHRWWFHAPGEEFTA